MKKIVYLFIFQLMIFGCKNQEKNFDVSDEKQTILQKIAQANGIENWKEVKKISYTFNVDRDSSHYERSWVWWPQENKVKMIGKSDTVVYERSQMDSLAQKTDRAFINDKYWLLFPFNLVWDTGFSHQTKKNVPAPISKNPMTEVVVSYNNTTGYTPGDTYKIYVDDEFIIREWSYVPSGKKEPAMSTTWEDYVEKNGIKIAKMHQSETGDFKIYFTGISVETP
ncbi:MAG TPA: hypothetical protein VFM65_10545 [Flavobacteriaceae bacterium]|nr:hypothetical protein [Flavobacteriaceae bacterium]